MQNLHILQLHIHKGNSLFLWQWLCGWDVVPYKRVCKVKILDKLVAKGKFLRSPCWSSCMVVQTFKEFAIFLFLVFHNPAFENVQLHPHHSRSPHWNYTSYTQMYMHVCGYFMWRAINYIYLFFQLFYLLSHSLLLKTSIIICININWIEKNKFSSIPIYFWIFLRITCLCSLVNLFILTTAFKGIHFLYIISCLLICIFIWMC